MNIRIHGIGQTACGELWNMSLQDLFREAVDAALADANLSMQEIDQVFIGNMLGAQTGQQSQIGALTASLYGVNIPSMRIEGACASGGLAVYQAIQALQSGNCKTALVVGVEKMTDFCAGEMAHYLMQAASEEERRSSITFAGLYALMAQAHMAKYGTTAEQLAAVSVIAHRSAVHNPFAHFQKEITVKDVLASTSIADPLHLLDCSPISDGAAAIILTTEETARNKKEAFIVAHACTTDTLSLSKRSTLTGIPATERASQQIFAAANITPQDIDIVELHDCFSIAALMALEDIGFVEKGRGGIVLEALLKGEGVLPTLNPSGGLKACGHPVGATGVKQVAEIALQLQNRAGKRQVKSAHYGLTHNIGGTGATCVMHLLSSSPE